MANFYPGGRWLPGLGPLARFLVNTFSFCKDEIQLVFSGGVTGPFGREFVPTDLPNFVIDGLTRDGVVSISPAVGFGDLNDGDNYVMITVPRGVQPVTVNLPAGTVLDPSNNPNQDITVQVMRL